MEEKVNTRQLALEILLDVEQKKKTLQEALHIMLKRYQYLPKKERAFLTRLCEGTVEYQIFLDYLIDAFSKIKVKKCKPCIRVILRMAVYQICFMSHVPKEAACNEAVKLAKKKGFQNLSGFVNGVLRNIVRNMDSIALPDEEKQPEKFLSVKYSTPEWLVSYLLEYYEYPVVKSFLHAAFEEKSTSIRVNISKTTVEAMVQKLQEKDILVSPGVYVENALHIWNYNYMRRVPGFSEGDFAVQDESSMLAGMALSPKAGSLIVDVCASPGGKSLDAADRMLAASMQEGNGQSHGLVIARDVSPDKLERFTENWNRMAFPNVKLEQWDGTALDASLVGTADYVICDVPCSGMGVIGRKPDIKYRLQREQLDSLVTLQRAILENAWQYLKPGGIMVFCTCTVNPRENEENLKWLTNTFPLVPESLDDYLPESLWNEDTKRGYLTMMPGIHACDGFFISRLRRV